MYTVYGDQQSGNCYKVRLALAHLGRDYAWRDVDILRGDTHTAEFLAMNPNGKIPVLGLEDGGYLAESGAILWYLAENTPLLPADRGGRARCLQWMFFEQYSHEPAVAVARFITFYLGLPDDQRQRLEECRTRGYAAFAVMERHLADRPYFATDHFSIADIALYAYSHAAHQGGFDLAPYPATRAWLARVRERPGHVAMPGLE